MAFELYGMLAGNVSPMTGENVKPAYGGEEEAFLRKVVTPIYKVIAKVLWAVPFLRVWYICLFPFPLDYIFSCFTIALSYRKLKEAKKGDQSIHNGGTMMI
jgi:hypothetical protein